MCSLAKEKDQGQHYEQEQKHVLDTEARRANNTNPPTALSVGQTKTDTFVVLFNSHNCSVKWVG